MREQDLLAEEAIMAGQVIKRGDKWVVRIFMGRDENGKRRYVNKTIRGTKKEANKYLTGKLRDKDLGINIAPASESLGKYLDKWLETSVKSRLRSRTYDDYAALMTRYVREPLGAIKLADLRPIDIQKVYQSMQERGLSARVVRYTHAVLSSALKQAVKWEMLHRNPASVVDLPRMVRKEMKAMSPSEASRFLEALEDSRQYPLFNFALTTGMRPQEYLGLKWSDIDMEKGSATVRRAIVWKREKGGGWDFAEPKTSRSRRTIPLPATTVKALSEHKRRQGAERLRIGSEWQDHGLVFPTTIGTPYTLSSLTSKWLKPALVKAELTGFNLYSLRHTHATLLLANGENAKVASERLGHSTIVLTLDTYSHVLPDMQQGAAERIENLLFKTGT
jgi:integrase